MTETDGNGAGRFQRIEDTLSRIETKLDSKADNRDVERIEIRVDQLVATGSTHARDALAEIKTLTERMTKVENTTAATSAVETALAATRDNTQRMKLIVWGLVINVIGTLAAVAFATVKLAGA